MRRYLDTLTTTCTAFESFLTLSLAMHGGYVPTIRPITRRNRILSRILQAKGFAVHGA